MPDQVAVAFNFRVTRGADPFGVQQPQQFVVRRDGFVGENWLDRQEIGQVLFNLPPNVVGEDNPEQPAAPEDQHTAGCAPG